MANSTPAEAPASFEERVRQALGNRFGQRFNKQTLAVLGEPRSFDAVSEDGRIVADAKRYTWGPSQPSAKLAHIAELVLVLLHVDAEQRLVVGGGDRAVFVEWLRRWHRIAAQHNIEVFYLDESDKLERVGPSAPSAG